MSKKVANKGQALIELVLAIAIATLLLAVLATGVIAAREGLARASKSLEANIILQKEVEAIRSVRETAWNSLIARPQPYHTEQSGSSWAVADDPMTEKGFTREFTVEDVCRQDPTSSPIDCGDPQAKIDPSTKMITAKVSWSFIGTQLASSSFYLSRYFGNTTWVQTTQADFNQGTTENTVITNNSGGEIELSQGSGGNWQTPQVVEIYNAPGSAGQGVFVSGSYAYMVSGGSGDDFFIFDVSDPENISLSGSLELGAIGYDVFVSGNYAYVATSHNSRELTVVDITTKSNPVLAGSGYDTTRGLDAYGVYVVGNTAYLARQSGRGDEFYVLDVTNPLSISLLDSLGTNTIYDVFVSGNYAYLASTNDRRELDVIDLSNPAKIRRAGSYNAPGKTDARGIFTSGTTAYLTTENGGDDLYLLDISNPSRVSLISSLELGGDSHDVFVDGTLAFVGTANTSSEFQVIDISTPANPQLYGSTNLNGLTNGVFVVGDYAYIANADAAAEFQVIKGGSGASYALSGTFESQTFDTGALVGFNFLAWTATEPARTNVQFQIATNNDGATWNFVGPDGTSATFYESPAAFPLDYAENRYIRFKITLSGDGSATPVVEDVTVNYSP